MSNSIELMKAGFDKLPADAQAAIRRFDYDGALKLVHKKYALHIDQAASLERLVSGVIFGDIKPEHLISSIGKELRVNSEKATEIGVDVNMEILIPIQKLMRESEEVIE